MQTIILHLDMNSYFASVEQQDNPEWRGRPVGVCEHLGGIIIGASREAKKWGINTGTPVWEARKLFPKIILTHTHAERYRFYTRRFLKVVSDYTDKVEKYSIDECFLDITRQCNIRRPSVSLRVHPKQSFTRNRLLRLASLKLGRSGSDALPRNDSAEMVNPFEEAVNIALEIKRRFKTEVGEWLTCSIGIADNKALAKIGSDLKKPDGIVVINDKIDKIDISDKNNHLVLSKDELYNRLKLTDVPGIGYRQKKNLSELGIKTLKDLRDYPKSRLVARFGRINGHHLYSLGQLEASWKSGVHQDDEIKSMGHMYTLPQEFRKPEFFIPVLYKLCEMVGRRLRRKNLMGNVISCYYHNKDYEGFGESKKLAYFLQDGREIFLEAMRILDSATDQRTNPAFAQGYGGQGQRLISGVKLIGVTVAGVRPYIHQLSLFGDVERERKTVEALDEINDKYGEFTILRAQMHKAGKVFRDSVGFGRMKEL